MNDEKKNVLEQIGVCRKDAAEMRQHGLEILDELKKLQESIKSAIAELHDFIKDRDNNNDPEYLKKKLHALWARIDRLERRQMERRRLAKDIENKLARLLVEAQQIRSVYEDD